MTTIPPISSAAAALRVQLIGQAENELVAGLAKVQTPVDAHAATTAPTPAPTPSAPPPANAAQVLHAALETAVSRQDGLGGLMADLDQALTSPALPASARAAIAQVLSLRTPLAPAPTAATLKQAVATSGLFLEQHVATGVPATPDMKASLLMLRQMLQTAAAASPPPNPVVTTPSAEPARHAPEAPPPFRGDPPHGQKPAPATLPPGATTPDILRHLERGTTAAIARQELFQLASLPDAPRAAPLAERTAAWLFEIPFVTAHGAAIAQFQIEREDGGGTGDAASAATATWRTRFSIDMEPLGPVHAQLVMDAGRTLVTLWAERDATVSQLRQDQGALAGEMGAEIAVYPGAPHAPPPAAGRFVDRAT